MTSSPRALTPASPAARRRGFRPWLGALPLSIAVVALIAPAASGAASGGWNHLGTGGTPGTPSLNGAVAALNADAPGLLLVGGAFTNAGGRQAADRIAMWNGNGWDPLGPITNGSVHAIVIHGGTVYAGGTFQNA